MTCRTRRKRDDRGTILKIYSYDGRVARVMKEWVAGATASGRN